MFFTNINDEHVVAICECCGEMFISSDYEDFCEHCHPEMDRLLEAEIAHLDTLVEDNLSYQEYLREHSA